MSIRALNVSIGRPVVTERVVQSPSASTALKNESVQRTDRLAFWNITELYASPLKLAS